MKSLEIKNIRSGYGSKQVVDNVSLSIKEGELCALLGLNGCGKSTLIKTLCGFVKASSGSFYIDDINLWKLNEKERAKIVAYIPQRGSQIYSRTALDVVLMGFNSQMSIFENYNNRQKEIAFSTLKKLGVEQLSNVLYEHLSEGQKQLVILARTMVQNTKIVLMDEPDSSLDFTNKNIILQKVKESITTENKIGLIALHDPNVAMSFCDKLFLMKNGEITSCINADEFGNFDSLEKELSKIYGNIKIINNDGLPVMVRK